MPHCVRWGTSSPRPHKKGAHQLHPLFGPCLYCGQTAGLIKIPLGTEVGLVPGDIVLDCDPAPPTESGTAATAPPTHTNSWMDQKYHSVRRGDIVFDGNLSFPTERRTAAPLFCPCLLWPNGRPSQQLLSSSFVN